MVLKKSQIIAHVNREVKNKVILVTGGAGSIGSELAKELMRYQVKAVRVLDIDEHALFKLGRSIKDKRLRLLLGSILDRERLDFACNGADIIIHTAAIKNIEISEYNPIEAIDTNINGTSNLIKTIIKTKAKKFLNISTDKAVEPSTLYGTTKQISEILTSWAGHHIPGTKFGTARIGNVMETRGNVFEIWNEELKENKPLSITDPAMKRYFFELNDAINFILKCLPYVNRGEIFVPKMKQFKIKDMANKKSKKQHIIGKRKGEKMEEVLMTKKEKTRSKLNNDMWIITSSS